MTRLVEWSLRRPRRVAAAALLLLVLAVAGVAQLGTSAAVRTIVGTGSPEYRAQRVVAERFGDEAIVVLLRESARDLTLTGDLSKVLALEGCLGGRTPDSVALPGGADGPCEGLRRMRAAQVVYGPATFISTGATALNEQIAATVQRVQAGPGTEVQAAEDAATRAGRSKAQVAAAGRAAEQAFDRETAQLQQVAASYGLGIQGVTATDPSFVRRFVFGGSADGPPTELLRPVFPTADAGLIAMRLRPGLSDDDRRKAADLVRRAVGLKDFALTQGGDYVVSGSPVLVGAVADELESALLALLAAGVLVMAAVLALTFPERRRLWPLGLALGTVLVVFGAIGLLGIPVNLGTIATLPVLLGLAVDYGVQLHARVEESRRRGLTPDDAVRDAVARGGRPVLLAAGATLAGFLALLASPTPLVRGFALVLIAGVALAVGAAFTIGLVLHARPEGAGRPWGRRRASRAATATAGPSASSVVPATDGAAPAGAPAATAPAEGGPSGATPAVSAETPPGPGIGTGPVVRRLVIGAHRRPRAVLGLGAVLAVAGIALGSGEPVETDLQRLVPGDLPALKDVRALERATGQSGEVQVLVRGRDLAAPKTLAWMDAARTRILADAGYDRTKGCVGARICPLGVPFRTLLGGTDPARIATTAAAETELGSLPDYFVGAQLTADRRDALLSFGIPLGSVEEQTGTLDRVRAAVARPPSGVTATVTGLPVLVGQAGASISAPLRRVLTLVAGLVLVGGVLLLATRSWRRALVPVLPVALAAGWSGLLTWLLGLPLNPLSVVLGALVVAIGTEFGVLLVERYGQERAAGHPDAVAIARTAASTGRAVGASAATTVAGFAVSDIPLLRQFGLITVLDLAVAVLAVVVVLPAVAGLAARRTTPSPATEPR
ncbi:MMPL family transporter [Patulibacter sp. NPDC049589]|uniref:efflux RND transporter permease subunit n=1 Tax=Patulibacter sp. NPDC049589 TaxID=3154731 RepID=UPI003431B55C